MTVPGKCALCLNITELHASHIIPEFMYKKLYDAKHKFTEVDSESDKIYKEHQKGIRQNLLCGKCEGKLSVYEKYVKENVYDILPKKVTSPPTDITLSVDYTKIKLFAISLVWRFGISTTSAFNSVNLGPYKERFREMLINDNPGKPHECGCILAQSQLTIVKGSGAMLCQPTTLKQDGFTTILFVTPDITWFFMISQHGNQHQHRNNFLQPSGQLIIYKHDGGITDELFRRIVTNVKKKRTID